MTTRADVTLLGFTLPDGEMKAIIDTDPGMPIQTHAFAWAIVKALQESGLRIDLLSAESVSNFPRNRRIWFRGHRFSSDGTAGESLGFLNIVGLKHLTRFGSCLLRGTAALRRARPAVLLIHGVHSPFLWYGVLARRLLRMSTVVLVTDPPGVVLPGDSRLVRMLKAIDVPLVRAALSQVDGVIALTEQLATEYAPGRPRLVMEGIYADPTDAADPVEPEPVAEDRTLLLYAGGLSSDYGVDRLVRAVEALGDRPVELRTFGRGELADWIDRRAATGELIDRHRFTTRGEVCNAYLGADVLIQPRPLGHRAAGCSFPSKLLEYMASGTPVLTTRLPGIPPDYEPYVYWIENDSSEGISESLQRVLDLPTAQREETGRRAADFIRSTRGPAAQGRRMRAFFESLHRE